jgi:hypothetical protein
MFICMLAAYITWHLKEALASLTFADENIPQPADPVAPAQRSQGALRKDATKKTTGKLPAYRYRDLLSHLATRTRQTINFQGQRMVPAAPGDPGQVSITSGIPDHIS